MYISGLYFFKQIQESIEIIEKHNIHRFTQNPKMSITKHGHRSLGDRKTVNDAIKFNNIPQGSNNEASLENIAGNILFKIQAKNKVLKINAYFQYNIYLCIFVIGDFCGFRFEVI